MYVNSVFYVWNIVILNCIFDCVLFWVVNILVFMKLKVLLSKKVIFVVLVDFVISVVMCFYVGNVVIFNLCL